MSDSAAELKPWDIENFRAGRQAAQSSSATPEPPRTGRKSRLKYDLDMGGLFWMAMGTSILTILTLGLYRFWMITKLRRHYWSVIRIEGDPLEYTGRGIEKFVGFLVAMVILAAYLAVVNLGLTFVGLTYFEANPVALQASILATLPLIFLATYRARSYIMARTRWRGIRFGMEGGAWGYMLRALLLGIPTILTAGLLWPYQQYKLEKYMVDRTWFGDQRFHQGGSWLGIFSYWVWIYILLALVVLAAIGMAMEPENTQNAVIGTTVIVISYFLLIIVYFRYLVGKFRYMWSHKTLGDASLENDVSVGGVVGAYIGGSILVGLCSTLVAGVVLGLAAVIWAAVGDPAQLQAALAPLLEAQEGQISEETLAQTGVLAPFFAGIAIVYLVMIATSYAFTQIFVIQPVLRRQVNGMTVTNVASLTSTKQREHDAAGEAGGFADALGVDVGAGL